MISKKIEYMNDRIPEFSIPDYHGEKYSRLIPDTLDLQDMARYCINVMTRSVDPEADFEMYFSAGLKSNPPILIHTNSDFCTMKFMEAMPLMRIITGSDENLEVEKTWMEVLLHELGSDGNVYMPKQGRPWAFEGYFSNIEQVSKAIEQNDQHIIPIYSGRLLSAVSLYYLRSKDDLWMETIRKMVDALTALAVDKEDTAYFSPTCMYAIQGSIIDYGLQHRMWGAESREISLGLLHAYRATGYEPAVTLAGKIVRYIVDVMGYFGKDGSFTPDSPTYQPLCAHFHVHTAALQSVLEYGMITGNREYLDLAKKGFEYGIAAGNTIMGYFPEFTGSHEHEECELCCVADMLALAVKLNECGMGDYWDDIDRWVRNMFAEGQLTPEKKLLLERYSSSMQPSDISKLQVARDVYVGEHYTTDRALERNIGAFAGWARPNDFFVGDYGPHGLLGIMHCCTGNAARAVYYVWKNMEEYHEGVLKINLLMNRTSKWADISSQIPFTGRIDIMVKEDCSLELRMPEWVSFGEVKVDVNSQHVNVTEKGRYVSFEKARKGDRVTMTFPIFERTDKLWIEKNKYTVIRRGNDIVQIDPPGRNVPLFMRDRYREDIPKYRNVERFVSDEDLYV